MNLLVADENKEIWEELASLPWNTVGIDTVYEAADSHSVKEILQKQSIDLVLSDIKLPELSGFELMEYIQKQELDVAVILLTDFADFEAEVMIADSECPLYQFIDNRVMGYLRKPIRPGEVLQTVSKIIQKLEKQRYRADVVRKYEQDLACCSCKEQLELIFRGRSETCLEILKELSENFAEDITLNSIADKYHFSPTYLSRVIKKETGYSFRDLLTGIRLLEAVWLLQEKDMTLSFLCDRTGFRDERSFGRVFKKTFGCSPGEFRRCMQQKNYYIQKILELMQKN